MQEVAERYARLVFAFALDRTGNREAAEELAQEILVELMHSIARGTPIQRLDAYVWKLCRYTWANWVDGRTRERRIVEQNGLPLTVADTEGDPAEQLIDDETLALLRREIAFLSETQRRIVVWHYVHGLQCKEIAARLNIPVGTVKWHLYRAKDELRRGMENVRTQGELSYDPVCLTGMGHCGWPGRLGDTASFLRRALTQNIVWAAYQRPMTIKELAQELGTAPPFIEDEVRYLVEYDFMVEVRPGAYQTNFIIWNNTPEQDLQIHNLFQEAAAAVAPLHAEALLDVRAAIDASGLYYPEGDFNFLMWTLLPKHAEEQATAAWRERHGEPSSTEDLPPRPDGGRYIAFAALKQPPNVSPLYDASYYSYCGPMIRSDGRSLYLWQVNTYWSDRAGWEDLNMEDIRLCHAYRRGALADEERHGEEYAFLLRKGYLLRTEAGYQFNVVWVDGPNVAQALQAALPDLRKEYAAVVDRLHEALVEICMQNKPNLIRDQVGILSQTAVTGGRLIAYILKHVLDAGKLMPPKPHQRKTITTWMQVLA